jgi:hypothetical protein
MSDFESLVQHYNSADTQNLLDIVEGRQLGYTEPAVLAAQSVLRGRGVSFREVPYNTLGEGLSRTPDPAPPGLWRIFGTGAVPHFGDTVLRLIALAFIALGIAGAVIWFDGYRGRNSDPFTFLLVLGAGLIGLFRPKFVQDLLSRRSALRGAVGRPRTSPRSDEPPPVFASSSSSIRDTVQSLFRLAVRIATGVALVYAFIAAVGLLMGDRWR